jgi:quercetin dioxygenase-like cupin family protein
MQRKRYLYGLAVAVAVIAGLTGVNGVHAQEQEEFVVKAKATKLLHTPLAAVEGKEVHIVHISAPQGFTAGKHSHPGPAFVYILEGQLTIEVEGMEAVTLGPGDVYAEPVGDKTMKAWNKSSTHGVKLIVFQIGDEGKPLMVKAE